MSLVRRILFLGLLSMGGLALLAPLAAQSAPLPMPTELENRLLPADAAPETTLDRGVLSSRQTADPVADPAAEVLAVGDALPTPGHVAMEAAIRPIATPPPPPPAPAPAPRRTVTYSGDSVWDDLARCESGGNWSINTGNGYYGGLQFNLATWHDFGGGEFAEYPHQATRAEQIVVAERLRAVRGYQPWPACRTKLGLP